MDEDRRRLHERPGESDEDLLQSATVLRLSRNERGKDDYDLVQVTECLLQTVAVQGRLQEALGIAGEDLVRLDEDLLQLAAGLGRHVACLDRFEKVLGASAKGLFLLAEVGGP